MPTRQPPSTTPERADADLLRSYARRDDVAAMDALVRRHADALRAFLRGYVDGDAAVEDLFQETWTRVIRRPDRFRDGSFRAWLLCIARNHVIDRPRRRAPALVDSLPDEDAPLPDDAAARKDLHERMLAAVRGLPGPQREVFLLRAEDIPFADIAARLRIPLNTALGRMHYAIQRLRRELSRSIP